MKNQKIAGNVVPIRSRTTLHEAYRVATAIILGGLPRHPPHSNHFRAHTILSDGSKFYLSLAAVPSDRKFPYGTDRFVLRWLIEQAIKKHSPFLSWGLMLKYPGLKANRRSREDLLISLKRIGSVLVALNVYESTVSHTAMMSIVRSYRLGATASPENDDPGRNAGIELHPGFLRMISASPWDQIRRADRRKFSEDGQIGNLYNLLIPFSN